MQRARRRAGRRTQRRWRGWPGSSAGPPRAAATTRGAWRCRSGRMMRTGSQRASQGSAHVLWDYRPPSGVARLPSRTTRSSDGTQIIVRFPLPKIGSRSCGHSAQMPPSAALWRHGGRSPCRAVRSMSLDGRECTFDGGQQPIDSRVESGVDELRPTDSTRRIDEEHRAHSSAGAKPVGSRDRTCRIIVGQQRDSDASSPRECRMGPDGVR